MFWRSSKGRREGAVGVPEPKVPERSLAVVRAYHEQTKHAPFRFASGPYDLDWANQPDPFRRYRGAELRLLERFDDSAGAGDGAGPGAENVGYDAALQGSLPTAPLESRALARFLFDALAISAWKEYGEARWALRVNPSSGNLHPTEAYPILPALAGLDDEPGVWHYAPAEHGLERRAAVPDLPLPDGTFLVALTTIAWREAWKYGERAFRYSHHDIGHAVGALAVAAAGLGWRAALVDELATDELARLVGVAGSAGPEIERAACLVAVNTRGADQGGARPVLDPRPILAAIAALAATDERAAWRGEPNDLSPEHVEWDAIDLAFDATAKPATPAEQDAAPPDVVAASEQRTAWPLRTGLGLRAVVRGRRSCLALDGRTGTEAASFFRLLEALMPRRGSVPFAALPWRPRIDLALFVHRVEGLAPGLYWLARDPARLDTARAALRPDFAWDEPPGCPPELPLCLLRALDLRRHATDFSCGQAIGGDGAFSLGMLAEFESTLAGDGTPRPWQYPRLFWEAGALGQRLYLEVEALGLRGTGIGCFFDDQVHALLGLRDRSFQSLYHFTAGGPVEDSRLTVLPAYG